MRVYDVSVAVTYVLCLCIVLIRSILYNIKNLVCSNVKSIKIIYIYAYIRNYYYVKYYESVLNQSS